MASVDPAPVPDALEAGRVWRRGRAAGFRERVEAQLAADPPAALRAELEAALREVERATGELDALADAQARGADRAPWWADGEYDRARADAHNDEGVRALAGGRAGDAFDAFTAAIGLYPSVAVYHSNRAVRAAARPGSRTAAEGGAAGGCRGGGAPPARSVRRD